MLFDFTELESAFSKKVQNGKFANDKGNTLNLLPFDRNTSIKFFKESPLEFLGEISRQLLQIDKAPADINDPEFEQTLIETVMSEIEFDDEEAKEFFYSFLEDYLKDERAGDLPKHPHLFLYNTVSEKEEKLKVKYAKFAAEVLFNYSKEAQDVFSEKEAENVLSKLVIQSLPSIEQSIRTKEPKKAYSILMEGLTERFLSDFLYLSKKKEYFLRSMDDFIKFYLFQYFLQFFKVTQSFGNVSSQDVSPLPFVLDWETGVGAYRDAVKEFRIVKENSDLIFPHTHVLSHLSHRADASAEALDVVGYDRILEDYSVLDDDNKKVAREQLIEWIGKYRTFAGLASVSITDNGDLRELFKLYFESVKQGMNEDVRSKYGSHLISVGESIALKNRGRHGKVLSLSQDVLLMLVGLSVRDEKIQLKELFVELSKRGVSFDHYSREEVIQLLDHLNYIEKKSDSGDAQYVKPIF